MLQNVHASQEAYSAM